jgi:hypothetical protein
MAKDIGSPSIALFPIRTSPKRTIYDVEAHVGITNMQKVQ